MKNPQTFTVVTETERIHFPFLSVSSIWNFTHGVWLGSVQMKSMGSPLILLITFVDRISLGRCFTLTEFCNLQTVSM